MLSNDIINCAPLIGQIVRYSDLLLCACKTIANKHERWILRAIECVGISDSLDARSAFAPKPSAKWRHMLSVPRVTPSNIAENATVPEPSSARAKKASIE